MGWKKFRRFFQACCGAGRHIESEDSYGGSFSEDDLRHPKNQEVLPKEKSGCRDLLTIQQDGQVIVENYNRNTGGGPSQDLNNAAENGAASENPHDEGQDFSGATRSAAAYGNEDHTSSGEDAEAEGCSLITISPVPEITAKLSSLSIESSSISPDETSSNMGNITPPPAEMSDDYLASLMLSPHRPPRPILKPSRKRSTLPPACAANVSKPASSLLDLQPPHSVQPDANTSTAAATAITDVDCRSPQVTSTKTDSLGISIPTLADNPEEFWALFSFLRDQLNPILKQLGPKTTPLDDETEKGRRIPITLERFDLNHRPISIQQMPLPQKASLHYLTTPCDPLPAIGKEVRYTTGRKPKTD